MHRRASFLVTVFSLSPLAIFAAPTANLDKEYDQVRAIVLRDPKVRAGFDQAHERLEAKIVEIDPALKGYVKGRATALPVNRSTKAAAAPLRKPFVKPTPGTARRSTHIIATGDTLSTVAARYRTTVSALKAANPKVDEQKLQVGESLTIVPAPHRGSTP